LALDGEPLVALGAPVSYCGLDDQGRVRCPEEGYDFGEPVVATAWIRDAAAFCVLLESGTLICSEGILDPPVLTDALQLSASSWRVCAVSRGGQSFAEKICGLRGKPTSK